MWPLAALLGATALFKSRPSTAWRAAAVALVAVTAADVAAMVTGTGSLAPLPALTAAGLGVCLMISRTRETPGTGAASEILNAWQASPLPAALADADGRVLWANSAWQREHGEVTSTEAPWQSLLATPEAEASWHDLYAKAEVSGAARGFLERRGPEETSWLAAALLLKSETTRGVHWFLTLDPQGDATFRLKTRKAGHDLNNLLSAIVGNVGLALEAPELPSQVATDLTEVETAAMRAAELIARLQAMSRGDL